MGLRMEWDINSEIKVDIATFTIPLALARNLGLRNGVSGFQSPLRRDFSLYMAHSVLIRLES